MRDIERYKNSYYLVNLMESTITISKEECLELKEHLDLDEELLMKLVRGLEDVRCGRVKSWEDVKVL